MCEVRHGTTLKCKLAKDTVEKVAAVTSLNEHHFYLTTIDGELACGRVHPVFKLARRTSLIFTLFVFASEPLSDQTCGIQSECSLDKAYFVHQVYVSVPPEATVLLL